MKSTRTYTMGARAEAVERTRQRIVHAMFELACERLFPSISLEDVASAADVSVQTILRQFGSRAGLVEAAMQYGIATVADERVSPVGDVDAAVKAIVANHEKRGSTALMLLAQEASDPAVADIAERGRVMHRQWVETVFAPYLRNDADLARLLVVATDVYAWKLLRHDRGLSRARTQAHVLRMVRALLAHDGRVD
jgi:AcrR family transcriptional regulator